MKKGVEVRVGPGDRKRLEAVVGSRNSPQKHVWRARVVLLSSDRVGTMAIQRQTGKSKPTIWRWQERFMAAGVDGLLRDATFSRGALYLMLRNRTYRGEIVHNGKSHPGEHPPIIDQLLWELNVRIHSAPAVSPQTFSPSQRISAGLRYPSISGCRFTWPNPDCVIDHR